MSMVSRSRIAKLANESNVNNIESVIGFASICYEAGMMEILKGIAEKELDRHPAVELSTSTRELINKVDHLLNILENTLNPEQMKLLKECGHQYQYLADAQANDYFIAGFMNGYRYLKSESAAGNKRNMREMVSI
jgi:hypothetical protein